MRQQSEGAFRSGKAAITLAVQGMAAGTRVLTLDGELPVEYLTPGDRILTRSGARVLRDVRVTVLQSARAVRISAETLGIDRPEDDMTVGPDQPVMVRDWRARALCGAPVGVVAATALCDGEFIREERVAELRLFTLHFDAAETVYACGLELGCPAVAVSA